MISSEFIHKFTQIAQTPDPDLATVSLLVARLEYPKLDAATYVERLDQMGETARERVTGFENLGEPLQAIQALNNYLFNEGAEDDLMRLAGWPSRTMLQRYAGLML